MENFTPLLPAAATEYPRGLYDPFPAFPIGDSSVVVRGFSSLAAAVPLDARVLAVDGFHGVDWDSLATGLLTAMKGGECDGSTQRRRVTVMDMRSCIARHEEIAERCAPFWGGDDPVFATHFPLGPEVFFDAAKVAKVRIAAACARSGTRTSSSGGCCPSLLLIIGVGAALVECHDALWYVDIPKDVLQERARSGALRNIGCDEKSTVGKLSFAEFYKRSYFVEWPALSRLKRRLLPLLDLFVDGQCADAPTALSGGSFRAVLTAVARCPFRVRPWFYPGVWGGQFMKGHMGLDPSRPNYAWSFEIIVTENGIVFEDQATKNRIECSFDCVMFNDAVAVQGEEVARQFGVEWPIRFDYLDTIDGGNLSTQCHPRPQYMRRKFGETYTQDETYYIAKCKPGARVYLGLEKTISRSALQQQLQGSFDDARPISYFDSLIHSVEAQPHDLFLIPNGTIHCSGAGNLVLEISSTPYIFTFKMYDYVRQDLNGKLRPMNIQRGSDNVRVERDAPFVDANYVVRSPPQLVGESSNEADWKEFVLYDRPETFYVIHRVEFHDVYRCCTTRGLAINLVEGRRVEVVVRSTGFTAQLSYLESMIIPAAVGEFEIRNVGGGGLAKIVKAFVRPGIGTDHPVNTPNDDVDSQ